MESDSDYEEASEDPFEGQFSDSDDSSDDSSDEIFLLQYYSLQRYANH